MTDTPTTIGALVRERREQLHLSQRGLGDKLGVSPNTIKAIEQGWLHEPQEPYKPQRKSLVAIAGGLNIPLERMLAAYGYETGERDKAQFDVSGLTPEQVESVRAFIEVLKQM